MALSTTPFLTTSFEDNVKADLQTYRNNTFNLNNYNEIYSTNKYLDKATSEEKNRLSNSLNQLRSSLLKMRQDYLIKKATVEEYKVRISILQWTIIAVCAMFLLFGLTLQQKLGRNLLTIIAVGVIVVYAGVVALVVKSNSYRFDTNWDMYYWGPVEKTY